MRRWLAPYEWATHIAMGLSSNRFITALALAWWTWKNLPQQMSLKTMIFVCYLHTRLLKSALLLALTPVLYAAVEAILKRPASLGCPYLKRRQFLRATCESLEHALLWNLSALTTSLQHALSALNISDVILHRPDAPAHQWVWKCHHDWLQSHTYWTYWCASLKTASLKTQLSEGLFI